jgi:hypothetical protein
MKRLTNPCGVLTTLLIAVSCLIILPMAAQTILIDSTFTSDGEIFPFQQNDTIYGLSISGSVTLSSDTSLVRVILTDEAGHEWMVYEAYPMILPGKHAILHGIADETMYLQVNEPSSLKIQVIQGTLSLDSLNFRSNYSYNLEFLQQSFKAGLESRKVDSINYYIFEQNWHWEADTTTLSNYSFLQKSSLFGSNFNLLGIDYYSGGIFMSNRIVNPSRDESELTKSFDWRKKHNANDETSMYWDGDLDRHLISGTWVYEKGNGWITGIKNQIPTNACAVFSSIASFEAMINLYFNHHLDSTFKIHLSDRQVYNCTELRHDSVGCDINIGKDLYDVLDFFKQDGVIPERCYPWDEPYCDGIWDNCGENELLYAICETHDTIVFIDDETHFSLSNIEDKAAYLKKALMDKGPLIIVNHQHKVYQ